MRIERKELVYGGYYLSLAQGVIYYSQLHWFDLSVKHLNN